MPAAPASENPILVPIPRSVRRTSGSVPWHSLTRIRGADARVRAAIAAVVAGLDGVGARLTDAAGDSVIEADGSVVLTIDPSLPHAQGYRLVVEPRQVSIIGRDEAGVYHGAGTLVQLARSCPRALPCLVIEDHPALLVRGALLDISRNRVPSMSTLCGLIDRLASWKYNQIQLYTEHAFAYPSHPQVWAEASPVTAAEITRLDAYCRERGIELVANQNSFGHLNRWLNLPAYRPLADDPVSTSVWGPGNLCPTDPASIDFLRGLYRELLPHFTSHWVNVGCDEVALTGRCRTMAADRSAERIYLDFVHAIQGLAREHGKGMQYWADLIMHHPELADQLPRGAMALIWNYEGDFPFARHAAVCAAAGVPFMTCPGTSSWASLGGRLDNMVANVEGAVSAAITYAGAGILMCDWGADGCCAVSESALALAGSYAWNPEGTRGADLIQLLDAQVFGDEAHVIGRIVSELGSIWRMAPCPPEKSFLTPLLFAIPGEVLDPASLDRSTLLNAQARMTSAVAPLHTACSDRPDAAWVIRDLENQVDMMQLAVRIGIHVLDMQAGRAGDGDGIASELRRIRGVHARQWVERYRIGGLSESLHMLSTGTIRSVGGDVPWYAGGLRF